MGRGAVTRAPARRYDHLVAAGTPDEALIRSVRAGDTAAFEALYRRHVPAVRKVLFAKLRQPDLVDDAIQDVFLKAMESIQSLREPDRLVQWLKAIARNVATERFRDRRHEDLDDLVGGELASTAPGLDEIGEVRELARLVQGAIAGLTPRDTEAVLLAGYFDASPAEIGERLGVSVGAAKVVLHRARRRLRLALKLELLVRTQVGACAEFRALAAADELVVAARHLAECEECQRAGSVEIRMYAFDGATAPARAVVVRGPAGERTLPIGRRLVIGRDCSDVPVDERVELDHEGVSRQHAELRVGTNGSLHLIDSSTNGTRLNGVRVERNTRMVLHDGDVVRVGDTDIEVRLPATTTANDARPATTVRHAVPAPAAMVVGDIIGFTSIAERSDSADLGQVLDELYTELKAMLRLSGGALGNIIGDAMFGVWDGQDDPEAPLRAIAFALAAHRFVARFRPSVELWGLDDQPLRMGWGVGYGRVAMPGLAGHGITVVGDAANVVFRLASLAGRNGLPPVLLTSDVAAIDGNPAPAGDLLELVVKGRETPVAAIGVAG